MYTNENTQVTVQQRRSQLLSQMSFLLATPLHLEDI